jgi:hypothetical protein
VGLGRGKLTPNWASSDDGCPSQSDGCPSILVEQNRHPGELATLVPSFSILTSSLSLPPRHTERLDLLASDYREEKKRSPRRRWEPLAGVHAHRWVDAPPSSGLTAASLRARTHRRGGERYQPWRSRPRAHIGERWSGCSTSTAAPTF